MGESSYVVVREIGRGSSGIVEEVERADGSDTNLALKRIHEVAAQDPEYLTRFKREVRILRGLRHLGIVEILEANLDEEYPWFVMPLAESSLEREIIHGHGLQDERIHELFGQVLDAISYAHHQGIIHRDLKPHNVLIIDGRAVISDFGLGRQFDSASATLTVTGGSGGTYGYVAPEQWVALHEVDERADIYALGSLLFQMATGLNPVSLSRQTVPQRYGYIINRCRAQEVDRRYSSVDELREDFDRLWLPESDSTPAVDRAVDLLGDVSTGLTKRRDLIDLYLQNATNEELYRITVPSWPDDLVEAMATEEPEAFASIVMAFDEHVRGNLDFGYVDTVADFLARVYQTSTDSELRDAALARVLLTGEYHGRWHAGGVFASMVKTARDADALAVRRVLYDNPRAANWVAGWVRAEGAAPIVLSALDDLEEAT